MNNKKTKEYEEWFLRYIRMRIKVKVKRKIKSQK